MIFATNFAHNKFFFKPYSLDIRKMVCIFLSFDQNDKSFRPMDKYATESKFFFTAFEHLKFIF